MKPFNLLKYDPQKHVLGTTYWEEDPRTTHRPVKFFLYVDVEQEDRIYVVKVDARRHGYMVPFGGCFSRVYISSVCTEEVHNQRLFVSREAANEWLYRKNRRNDVRELFGDIA